MLTLLPTRQPRSNAPTCRRRVVLKATRPALTDLRFKGDACVVTCCGETASLCLGDYAMLQIAVTPFDLPALNTTLQGVRLGQARREHSARRR